MSIASHSFGEAAIAEAHRRSVQKAATPARRTVRPKPDDMLVAEAR